MDIRLCCDFIVESWSETMCRTEERRRKKEKNTVGLWKYAGMATYANDAHTFTRQFTSLSYSGLFVCLFLFLFVCMCAFLLFLKCPFIYFFTSPFVYLYISLFSPLVLISGGLVVVVCFAVFMYMCVRACVWDCESVHVSACVCLSVCLSLSVCLWWGIHLDYFTLFLYSHHV